MLFWTGGGDYEARSCIFYGRTGGGIHHDSFRSYLHLSNFTKVTFYYAAFACAQTLHLRFTCTYCLALSTYQPTFRFFLSIINVSVVSYIHTTLNIKYRYLPPYLPTYLLTWLPIFNLHSSVLGLLGYPGTKFYFYFFWRAGGVKNGHQHLHQHLHLLVHPKPGTNLFEH